MIDTWTPPDLSGRIAVVTGARRNIGRGVAVVLGSCGATVYVTGRPHGAPPPDGLTLDETAMMVTERGGRGIAVVCDHDDHDQVNAVFSRIGDAEAGIDILVNNVVHWALDSPMMRPPWTQPIQWFEDNLRSVTAHYTASRAAVPLMLDRAGAIVVSTCEGEGHVDLPLRMRADATASLVQSLAHWLTPHPVTSLGVIPGEPRTHVADERTQRDIEAVILASTDAADARHRLGEPPLSFETARIDRVLETQSIELAGRAVAALYAAEDRDRRSGLMWRVGDLARSYGFTDRDGLQRWPHADGRPDD